MDGADASSGVPARGLTRGVSPEQAQVQDPVPPATRPPPRDADPSRQTRSDRGGHAAGHLAQPKTHPALDCADRRIEHCGDLGVGVATVVGERDYAALLGWEPVDRGQQLTSLLAPTDLPLCVLRCFEQVLDRTIVGVSELVGDALAQHVYGAVADDPQQPRPGTAPAAVEVPPTPPSREERLLDDLLRDRRPRAHLRGEGHGRADMTTVEKRE